MKKSASLFLCFFALTLFIAPVMAHASGSGALPWEGPLKTIEESIRGPVAMSISLIAIVITGAMLVWGGEISDFAKSIIKLVMVIALIVGAAGLLSNLFGTSGATIALNLDYFKAGVSAYV